MTPAAPNPPPALPVTVGPSSSGKSQRVPAVCPYCGGAHTLSQCPRWRC